MRTIAIAGGYSSVGRRTITELAKRAAAARFHIRSGTRRKYLLAKRLPDAPVDLHYLDFNAPRTFRPFLEGVDTLFLNTGYDASMVQQQAGLIAAAEAAGVAHVVRLGAHFHAATDIVHHTWHRHINNLLAASRIGWTTLNPNWFMDNVWMSPQWALSGFDTLFGFLDPDRAVSWISADDIAAAAANVLIEPQQHVRQHYQLAVEVASMRDIQQMLHAATRRRIHYFQLPQTSMQRALIRQGFEPEYARSVATVQARTNAGRCPDAATVCGDTAMLIKRQPQQWPAHIAAAFSEAFAPRHVAPANLAQWFARISAWLNHGRCVLDAPSAHSAIA